MTPDERQMIADLFQTIRSMGGQDKDREAEAFINQMMRQTPDSPYLLAQIALVRDMELQQANERIGELEQQLQGAQAPAQRGGGSFLGGAAAAGAGAGAIGARASGSVYGGPQPAAAQPWGQASGGFQGRAAGQAPMPLAQQPVPPPAAQAQPAQRSGGGFLKGALAAAAGVAGGVLLADSIRGMFGGSSAQAASGGDQSTGWQSDKADESYKNDDGSNDQGDWGGDSGGGDVEL